MSTGATDEQIEAAARRMHGVRTRPDKVPHGGWPCSVCHGQADAWAPCFVPDGQVIVDAARVPTDDELAAMEVLSLVADRVGMWHWQCEVLRAYLERQR